MYKFIIDIIHSDNNNNNNKRKRKSAPNEQLAGDRHVRHQMKHVATSDKHKYRTRIADTARSALYPPLSVLRHSFAYHKRKKVTQGRISTQSSHLICIFNQKRLFKVELANYYYYYYYYYYYIFDDISENVNC